MPSMIEIILLIILHIWLCRQGGDHFWSESRLNISLLMLEVEGNDSNLLIVFYVQIMPDDFVMQLHRF